jgi:hypothetical protein
VIAATVHCDVDGCDAWAFAGDHGNRLPSDWSVYLIATGPIREHRCPEHRHAVRQRSVMAEGRYKVLVEGGALTRERAVELRLAPSRVPFLFDEARDLPRAAADALEGWVRQQRPSVEVEVVPDDGS